MAYSLHIQKQVRKKLQNLDTSTRARIIDKLNMLEYDPDDQSLDIKPLVGGPYHRLRVGDWRILFLREDILRIISVEKLKTRGDVYK